jgi:hypothetical protein
MKSPKSAPKNFPTTTDLRVKDLPVLRAEIDHFRAKITDKTLREPHKAALILSEWLNPKASTTVKKKAA